MASLADSQDVDIRSLRQLLVYGLKGMAAYADHALVLGKTDDSIFAFMHEALSVLAAEGNDQPGVEDARRFMHAVWRGERADNGLAG